jgi:hypothetical protein
MMRLKSLWIFIFLFTIALVLTLAPYMCNTEQVKNNCQEYK